MGWSHHSALHLSRTFMEMGPCLPFALYAVCKTHSQTTRGPRGVAQQRILERPLTRTHTEPLLDVILQQSKPCSFSNLALRDQCRAGGPKKVTPEKKKGGVRADFFR